MKIYTNIIAVILSFLTLSSFAQNSPEELGEKLFLNFSNGTLTHIDSLIPSKSDMKTLAVNIGLSDTSKQFIKAIANYDEELKNFHKKINLIYSDTSQGLNWSVVELEKISSSRDSIQIDDSNPNSPSVEITEISIYFRCRTQRYCIVLGDAFILNSVWKMGNNIYINKLE